MAEQTFDRNGITFAVTLREDGGGEELTWDDIRRGSSGGGAVWLHLQRESEEAGQWLREESGLSPIVVDALLASNTRPRWVAHHDGLFVNLRGVNLNPGADPEDMISLRIWLERDRIITVHRERIMTAEDVAASLREGGGATTTAGIFSQLVTGLITRMAPTIDSIEDRLDELEPVVVDPSQAVGRAELTPIRQEVLSLLRYMAPQREALASLHRQEHVLLAGSISTHLQEALNRLIRLVEDIENARQRAQVLQDEISTQIAETTNSRIYAITVIAAIFLPLTFLTGLMGTNVGGIPLGQSESGFLIETAILVVVGAMFLVYFRWRKWI